MPGCGYKTLNNLSSGNLPKKQDLIGIQIIPDYKAPTLNTLTHGVKNPGCSNFFDITTAYGKNASQCNQKYIDRPCK